MHRHESLIRRFVAAGNAADRTALLACITPDAVHYFPPGIPGVPWRGAATIAERVLWNTEHLGSRWTVEKVLAGAEGHEAAVEWTHWERRTGTAQRGCAWFVFEAKTGGLIQEIRSYNAAPAVQNLPIAELVEFDYLERGYHLHWE